MSDVKAASPSKKARDRTRLILFRGFERSRYSRAGLLSVLATLHFSVKDEEHHTAFVPLELHPTDDCVTNVAQYVVGQSFGPVAPSKPLSALGNACLVARCPKDDESPCTNPDPLLSEFEQACGIPVPDDSDDCSRSDDSSRGLHLPSTPL